MRSYIEKFYPMNKFFVILLAVISFFPIEVSAKEVLPKSLDDALQRLDVAISQRESYNHRQMLPVDSLKRSLSHVSLTAKPALCQEIGDAYRRCNIDSALYYYKLGAEVAKSNNDKVMQQQLSLSRVAILPVQGVIKEAEVIYDSIAKELFPQNKQHFYEVGNRLFFFASSFYPIAQSSRYYADRALVSTDSLLKWVPAGSHDAKLYQAQLDAGRGDYASMVVELAEVVDNAPINQLVFARAVSHLAEYYGTQKGKETEQLYYLALASLSDVYSGTMEGTALQQLGVELYHRGDITRAYRYLSLSLDNAVTSGSRIRALQSAEVYPIISQAFKSQDETKLTWLTWLVVALIVALVVIVSSLVFLRKEMRKLSELKVKLSRANVTKDTYISQFLSLSSIYIEKLEEFHRVAKRKLKANQVSDLFELLESEKMLAEQSQMFYKIFDNAFIHIYPTFVDDVNKLLQPDKRFELPEMKLNTELRILAFLRLGIDDSEQIARFLGLSLNTIYTYRNRLKGRAINRDAFDAEVMKIGAID